MRGVVLIHGGFHGGWCWTPVIERLEDRGVTCLAPDLPMESLGEDITVARTAIDELADRTGGDIVLVGHSYGGLVLSGQRTGAPVSSLVFASAVVAQEGESIVDVINSGPHEESPLSVVTEVIDGWMYPIAGPMIDVLYNDVDPEVASVAASQLRRQTLECVTTGSPGAFWRDVPTTFIMCEHDQALPFTQQQRFVELAGARTVTVPSGHSVFYTYPDVVADTIWDLAIA